MARPRPRSQVWNTDDHLLCHLASDDRITMHHSYGKMHPTAEAVSFHVAVTSGFCPGLLKGHISESTEVDPGLRPGFQTLTVPLISTKCSFCALSPIHVSRGYSWGAQMLLGTHIPGWTVLVVAMTTEPKLHN